MAPTGCAVYRDLTPYFHFSTGEYVWGAERGFIRSDSDFWLVKLRHGIGGEGNAPKAQLFKGKCTNKQIHSSLN